MTSLPSNVRSRRRRLSPLRAREPSRAEPRKRNVPSFQPPPPPPVGSSSPPAFAACQAASARLSPTPPPPPSAPDTGLAKPPKPRRHKPSRRPSRYLELGGGKPQAAGPSSADPRRTGSAFEGRRKRACEGRREGERRGRGRKRRGRRRGYQAPGKEGLGLARRGGDFRLAPPLSSQTRRGRLGVEPGVCPPAAAARKEAAWCAGEAARAAFSLKVGFSLRGGASRGRTRGPFGNQAAPLGSSGGRGLVESRTRPFPLPTSG